MHLLVPDHNKRSVMLMGAFTRRPGGSHDPAADPAVCYSLLTQPRHDNHAARASCGRCAARVMPAAVARRAAAPIGAGVAA